MIFLLLLNVSYICSQPIVVWMQDEEIIKVFSDFNFLNACGYFNPLGEINVLMEEIDRIFNFANSKYSWTQTVLRFSSKTYTDDLQLI